MLLKALMLVLATLTYTPDSKEPFTVTFEKGAVYSCSIFHAATQTIEIDGKVVPYEPKKCYYGIDDMDTFAENWDFIQPNGEDWTVWMEFEYVNPDGSVRKVKTNVITARPPQ